MGSNYTCNRLTQGAQHLLPDSLTALTLHAGIHHIKPLIGFQYVQVDVVEGKRQRHTKPVDAGGDLAKVARGWYRMGTWRYH